MCAHELQQSASFSFSEKYGQPKKWRSIPQNDCFGSCHTGHGRHRSFSVSAASKLVECEGETVACMIFTWIVSSAEVPGLIAPFFRKHPILAVHFVTSVEIILGMLEQLFFHVPLNSFMGLCFGGRMVPFSLPGFIGFSLTRVFFFWNAFCYVGFNKDVIWMWDMSAVWNWIQKGKKRENVWMLKMGMFVYVTSLWVAFKFA